MKNVEPPGSLLVSAAHALLAGAVVRASHSGAAGRER